MLATRRTPSVRTDSAALDDNIDYQDVKFKIVQQEGYDEHDFNLFDDRSSLRSGVSPISTRRPGVDCRQHPL